MTTHRLETVLGPLLRAAHEAEAHDDGQLLARFVRHGDEAAFALLVRRHGAMVLGVCRRILNNAADADDAFQATFLVLVRKARSLSSRPVLGDYLHGMARRTALNARRVAARRRRLEQAAARPMVPAPEPRNDFLPLLDEALVRLPEKYRLPLVLCDLEGRTRHEAARQLGWAEGTVAGRLARARALLARRLAAGASLLAAGSVLGEAGMQAAPPALVLATVQTAASVLAGETTASASVLTLTKGVIQSMLWHKIKLGVVLLLAAVATAGVGGLTYQVAACGGEAQTASDGPVPTKPKTEAGPPKRLPPVRELDLSGLPEQPVDASKEKGQVVFENAAQLTAGIPSKEWQTKITKQVNFDEERLLFFSWTGSSDDKLTYTVEETKPGPTVVFHYAFGKTNRMVPQAHLFALPRDVGFKVGDEAKEKDAPAIHEIDLTNYTADPPKGAAAKPLTITDRDELANAITDRTWRLRIAKEVNFSDEHLLFFRWVGSSGDKLWATDEQDNTGRHVVFHYYAGAADDGQSHFRLFAVRTSVRIEVKETKTPPTEVKPAALPGPPVREIDVKGMTGTWTEAFGKPEVLRTEKELTDSLTDKKFQAAILKQVDFSTEMVLFFGWSGGVGEQLWYTVEDGDKGLVVVYHHYRGPFNDKDKHARLFAFVQAAKVPYKVEESSRPGPPLVRGIDLTGFQAPLPKGTVEKPTVLTSAEEAAKVFTDEGWRARILAKVNFEKEQLLYFAWTDAPGAELIWSATKRAGQASVSFHYRPGNGDDKAVPYFRLFAVAKEATWRVGTGAPAPGNGSAPPPGSEATDKLLKQLDSPDPAVRAAVADKLGERKAKEAVPKLIERVSDLTALGTAEDQVRFHAAKALTTITGQTFGTDAKKWKEWLKEQKPETATAADTLVEVLQADATVRLHGVLAHTPKGIFLLVKETNATETSAWELDVSTVPGLDKTAKDLSGKAVTATGTCPMVRVPPQPFSLDAEPRLSTEGRWDIKKTVKVTKLAEEK